MKLNAYTDQVNLNTIGNARYNVDHKDEVYANTQMPTLTGEVANYINEYVEYEAKEFENKNKIALMNAKTAYATEMKHLKTELLLLKEGGAAGAMATLKERQEEAKKRIKAGLPAYEQVHDAFDQEVFDIDAKDTDDVYVHMRKEEESFKQTSLSNSNEVASDRLKFANTEPEMRSILEGVKGNTALVFSNYGEAKVQSEVRSTTTKLITETVDLAIENKEFEKAATLVRLGVEYGMDMTNAFKYNLKINDKVQQEGINEIVNYIVNKYPNDSVKQKEELGKMLEQYEPKGLSVDEEKLQQSFATLGEMKYKLAGNMVDGFSDCGLATQFTINASGGNIISREADRQWLQAKEEGRVVDPKDVKNGDLVFWRVEGSRWIPTNDPSKIDPDHAYEGVTHVGIYYNGKVYQMGEHGFTAIDMDTYEVVGVGRFLDGKSMGEQRRTAETKEKAFKALDDANKKRKNELKELDAEINKQMNELLTIGIQTKEDPSITKRKIDELMAQYPELAGLSTGKTWRSYSPSLKTQSDTGSKGKALDEARLRMWKKTVASYKHTDDELYEMVEKMNEEMMEKTGEGLDTLTRMKLLDEITARKEGKGIYKDDIPYHLKELVDKGEVDADTVAYYKPSIIELVIDKKLDFMIAHNGEEPNYLDVQAMVKEVAEKKDVTLSRGERPFFSFDSDWVLSGTSAAEREAKGYELLVMGNDKVAIRVRGREEDIIVPRWEVEATLRELGLKD